MASDEPNSITVPEGCSKPQPMPNTPKLITVWVITKFPVDNPINPEIIKPTPVINTVS
ncbi:MAG: hypothetical protein ACWIPH_09120 [Ostreibacterium sp.]